MATRMPDLNCITTWLPRLIAAGAAVPKTELLTAPDELSGLCEGEGLTDSISAFFTEVTSACERMGYPCFLRSGQTSNKHEWINSCFVADGESVANHVANICDFSHMVDFLGLSVRVWAVRKFLSLLHEFTAFHGMPVAYERRYFVRDGVVLCGHPYWPYAALRNMRSKLVPAATHEVAMVMYQNWVDTVDVAHRRDFDLEAVRLAPHFPEGWSLDMCLGVDGNIYVTDMAEMKRSFHWDGCPNGNTPTMATTPPFSVAMITKLE